MTNSISTNVNFTSGWCYRMAAKHLGLPFYKPWIYKQINKETNNDDKAPIMMSSLEVDNVLEW